MRRQAQCKLSTLAVHSTSVNIVQPIQIYKQALSDIHPTRVKIGANFF